MDSPARFPQLPPGGSPSKFEASQAIQASQPSQSSQPSQGVFSEKQQKDVEPQNPLKVANKGLK